MTLGVRVAPKRFFIFPPATQVTWQAIARLQDWDAIEARPNGVAASAAAAVMTRARSSAWDLNLKEPRTLSGGMIKDCACTEKRVGFFPVNLLLEFSSRVSVAP
jgi:hypothetical protein